MNLNCDFDLFGQTRRVDFDIGIDLGKKVVLKVTDSLKVMAAILEL
jgi:hypothetical protein